MFVITLKDGEVLNIGDDIKLVVLPRRVWEGKVCTHQCRIAVGAPKDIPISRPDMKEGPDKGVTRTWEK